jgi:hypothetical protein
MIGQDGKPVPITAWGLRRPSRPPAAATPGLAYDDTLPKALGAAARRRVTRVREISSAGISPTGSTWSTASSRPIAASGIPKNAEDAWSAAITVPPKSCTATAPVAPSLPPPDKMTAIVRRAATSARDVSSKSADGRAASDRC